MQPFSDIFKGGKMTYCKNCHKMSKDDDFCSHCGSAVWGEDYVSQDAAINCDTMKDHSHDKVTYSKSERGEGVHIPEGYKPYNPTHQQNYNKKTDTAKKNSKAASGIAKAAILLVVLRAILKLVNEFLN